MYATFTACGFLLIIVVGTSHASISDLGALDSGLLKTFSGNASNVLTLPPLVALSDYNSVADEFLAWIKSGNRTGVLATAANFTNFQAYPNASMLASPWEVHVAPALK